MGGEYLWQDLFDPCGEKETGSYGYMISPHQASKLKIQNSRRNVVSRWLDGVQVNTSDAVGTTLARMANTKYTPFP